MIRELEAKKTQSHDQVVIVGLSGNSSFEGEAIKSGMNGFLVKPTAPHRVIEVRYFSKIPALRV